MASRLERLPDGVLLDVFGRLEAPSIAALRRASGRLREASRGARWQRLVVGTGLPGVDGVVRALERGDVAGVGRLEVRRYRAADALRVLDAADRAGLRPDAIALCLRDSEAVLSAALLLAGRRLATGARRVELKILHDEGGLDDREGVAGALARAFAAARSVLLEVGYAGESMHAVLRAFSAATELSLSIPCPHTRSMRWGALEGLPHLRSLVVGLGKPFAFFRKEEVDGLAAFLEGSSGGIESVEVRNRVELPEDARLFRAIGGRRRGAFEFVSIVATPEAVELLAGPGPRAIRSGLIVRGAPAADALAGWLATAAFGPGSSVEIVGPLPIGALEAIAGALPAPVRAYQRVAKGAVIDVRHAPRELAALLDRPARPPSIAVAYALDPADPELEAAAAAVDALARRAFGDAAGASVDLRFLYRGDAAPTERARRRALGAMNDALVRGGWDIDRAAPIRIEDLFAYW